MNLNDLVYSVTARLYCSCGEALHTTAAWDTVAETVMIFWSQHQGDGHGPTDPDTARRARLRHERKVDKVARTGQETMRLG
jgi:hypothetical protein